ncbi:UTRA domain-containing protein [Caulobacter sp. 17J65-9]|uniref:UTRA domain-containing protein n=1 Tax=Caulobacter sp. 17J65-9 TaxID=2709382 RepID=UPI0013C7AC33|nr:UTRA domain-containing protein [Caulobacter sp. 17J65-9]NEX92256.1 UTRA domain-containing protein [Caulobacter sp. 17J65-9]
MREPTSSLQGEIRAFVLEKIVGGEWAPGARVPSETELVARFGTSRMTVHHALKALTAEGYLRRVKGLGTFVAPPRAHVLHARLTDVADEITERGGRHRTEVLDHDVRCASSTEAALFQLPPGERLLHARLLHFENDTPLQIEDRLIDPARVPGVEDLDPAAESYFAFLMGKVPYPAGRAVVRAVMPPMETRFLLRMGPEEPALEVERVTRAPDGAVLTVARLTYPGTRYVLSGEIAPPIGRGPDPVGDDE